MTNVDGLDGLDMGTGRVGHGFCWIKNCRVSFFLMFFLKMALGEEFRFEFHRSMPMRASKFECTYSKFGAFCS